MNNNKAAAKKGSAGIGKDQSSRPGKARPSQSVFAGSEKIGVK